MFCRYLVIQRVLPSDVSSIVDSPKKWNRLPTVIDDAASRRLMATPDEDDDRFALRDRAMLAMLYATGMRAAEVAGLQLTDVNANVGVVRVLGKGNKERIVPVAKEAIACVGQYLCVRPAEGQSKALFLSRSGRKLRARTCFGS